MYIYILTRFSTFVKSFFYLREKRLIFKKIFVQPAQLLNFDIFLTHFNYCILRKNMVKSKKKTT